MLINIIVKLGNFAIVNAQKFVKSGNHSYFTTFTLKAFLLYKIVDRVAYWFMLDKAFGKKKDKSKDGRKADMRLSSAE